MDDVVVLEEVRCRGCLGVLGLALRNFAVYHDIVCATEPFPANTLDARDAIIENLILSGELTRAQMAEANEMSRQRIDQILKRMRP